MDGVAIRVVPVRQAKARNDRMRTNRKKNSGQTDLETALSVHVHAYLSTLAATCNLPFGRDRDALHLADLACHTGLENNAVYYRVTRYCMLCVYVLVSSKALEDVR